MATVAIIEAKPSKTNFNQFFKFDFDRFSLSSDSSIKKVLKKDVDLNFNPDNYTWVILIGSEPLKYFTKVTQITQYAGTIIDNKFLPIINPSMIAFKPEVKKLWEDSLENILGYISGDKKKADVSDERFIGIRDTEEALAYIQKCIDSPEDFVGIDSETTGLYPRNAYMLGISLSYCKDMGALMQIVSTKK